MGGASTSSSRPGPTTTGRSATRAASSTIATSTSGRGRYQQPHPPIWMSTTSPGGAARVGARGYVQATFLTGFDGTRGDLRRLSPGLARGGAAAGRAGATASPMRRWSIPAETEARGARRRREAAVVHDVEQGAAALRLPARLHADSGAGARCCAAPRSTSTRRSERPMNVDGADRGRHHDGRHARPGVPADQEASTTMSAASGIC